MRNEELHKAIDEYINQFEKKKTGSEYLKERASEIISELTNNQKLLDEFNCQMRALKLKQLKK